MPRKDRCEELLKLPDDELIMVVRNRVAQLLRNSADSDLEKIPAVCYHLIVASTFEQEMQNGGLCQFLVNLGRVYGPVLQESLEAFGADRHAGMTLRFCWENGIDLSNLQEFAPGDVDRYMQLSEKYPFEKFDRAYLLLERVCPLESILGEYIRRNISQFDIF